MSLLNGLGNILLSHLSRLLAINADKKVVALHTVSGHDCAGIDMQHMWWLVRRDKAQSTPGHDNDLGVHLLSWQPLGECYMDHGSLAWAGPEASTRR